MWADTTRAQHAHADLALLARWPAVADAAALLPAGLHGATLVLPVARKQAVVVSKHALLLIGREAVGREASPGAGVIDSHSLKTTGSGVPWGCDAGKMIKGKAPHPDRPMAIWPTP